MPARSSFRFFEPLLAAVAALSLLPAVPATAAAHNARIVAIFRTSSCAANPCDPARDPTLANDALVTGTVDVRVSADADLGLEWVRLEAQNPGDVRWYCLEFWDAGRATHFEQTRRWVTTNWTDPRKVCARDLCSHCIENSPHRHGAPTEDLVHKLRVVARESGQTATHSIDAVSPEFDLRVQNAPTRATWSSDPSANGTAVLLQWKPNPETDIAEYTYVRIDPNGSQVAFAIDASDPERQGCQRAGSLFYRCTDHSFGAGAYGGDYRYAVFAARTAFSGERCRLSNGTCLAGPLSDFRTVHLDGSAAGPAPTTSAGVTVAPSPSTVPTGGATPAPVTPPSNLVVASGAAKKKGGSALLWIFGAVAIASAGGFGAWRLARRSN